MVLLRDFPRSMLPCLKGQETGKVRTWQVYHDALVPQPSVSVLSNDAALAFQFAALLAGVPATALVDTGAPSCFASKSFAQQAGLSFQAASSDALQCANGSELSTYGHMKVILKIQGYTSAILLTISDIASSNTILGEDWQIQR